MLNLTADQIAAAKAKDLEATAAIATATEERVMRFARDNAKIGGRVDHELMEDLAQVGRFEVWQCIERFEGATVGEFSEFIDRSLRGVMWETRQEMTRQGVSADVAKSFDRALRAADRDPYEAEKLATTVEVLGAKRRLSPESAHAARLAYQGTASLDAPAPGDPALTLGATLADVPADLVEASDLNAAQRQETKRKVHAVLELMGDQQRVVLKALTGIDPVGYYGAEYDEELAADHGMPRERIKVIRSKGKARFRELWTVQFGEVA